MDMVDLGTKFAVLVVSSLIAMTIVDVYFYSFHERRREKQRRLGLLNNKKRK